MCGRFTLKTNPDCWAQLLLPLKLPTASPALTDWQPRYNIAPTQSVLALTSGDEGTALESLRWGLLPFWAKDLSIGNRMINARSETLSEKRSFAKPFESQRCLILADGYYEWQKLADGTKRPIWISPAEGGLMLMAGLWESNSRATDSLVRSCTVITTAANSGLNEIHDRMPVVVQPEEAELWLNPNRDSNAVHELLGAAEPDYFRFHEVSTLVNSPKNDLPDCIVEKV
ncbi:MAG: SOS response-associated peptidase [Aureliella sp.]